MTDAKGQSTNPRAAFSLIEVLSVILLLTVLLLATLPAFRSARSSAQRNTAAAEAMEIASAALEFRRTYGSWPCEEEAEGRVGTLLIARKPNSKEDSENLRPGELDLFDVIHTLLGEEDFRKYNPRAIPFLELSRSCLHVLAGESKAYPYDPWGRPYVLVMSRPVPESNGTSWEVNQVEGGCRFGLNENGAALGVALPDRNGTSTANYVVESPDDASAFSWGDPTRTTDEPLPARIVGSWSTR